MRLHSGVYSLVFIAFGFSGLSVAADNVTAEKAHEEKVVDASRPVDTSKPLRGIVSVKIEDGREWRYFKVGETNYKITKCTEKCQLELFKCKGGEECEIRAEVEGDSIVAKSLKVLSSETKTTNPGNAKFTRVSEETLSKLKVESKKFGEAWRDPSGMTWGDIAKKEDGAPKYMNHM